MKNLHRCILMFLFAVPSVLFAQTGMARKIWVGTVTYHGQRIPIRLALTAPGAGGAVTGTLLNGPEQDVSSSGTQQNGQLHLDFNYFARQIDGTISADAIRGTYSGARVKQPLELTLHPESPNPQAAASPLFPTGVSGIDGDWEIAVQSPKGESAWTLHVDPYNAPGSMPSGIQATIQRIDGDTGGLYGAYDAPSAAYRVSHFTASGPALYTFQPNADGTLTVRNLLSDSAGWTARRVAQARSEHLAPPTQANEQTGVIDPSKPLAFTGVDLQGNTVSSNDPRFRGKVVIAAVGGSWCPNCHDEAPLLVELYRRFHAQGLEVVNLSFEEEDQLRNPERLRAFVARYHIPYTVLLMGTTDQLNERLPQGKNLNSWPTSFFIGRNGLVQETHAGFSGPATGQSYVALRAETIALLQRLLAQPTPSAQ